MDDPRPEKVAVVHEVRERFDQASAAILTKEKTCILVSLNKLK